MINTARLSEIIKGEDDSIELKSSFSKSAIESLVAFANTKGGKVVIGVTNEGKIVGTIITEESVQNWVNEIKQSTEPSIIPDTEIVEIEDRKIVIIKINEFPLKPIAFKGRYYSRKQNANHQLSISEINDLFHHSLQTSWDSYPSPDATMANLDEDKVRRFIARVNENRRFTLDGTLQECLQKLKLIKDNRPTNAAMILFSKQNLLYNVHIGRFKTSSMIIDDKMINGGLYEVLEKTMQYILSQIKVAFEITGKTSQRTEILEYPLPAVRELVLNALVHRDYTSPTDIQIKIFDHEITIFNPGKLFGGLTVEDLKTDSYQAQTRNKLIAEAFYLTNDIEKYGSGYRRVRNQVAEYPTMKFDFMENSGGYLARLSYSEQKTSTYAMQDTMQDVMQDTMQVRELVSVLVGEMPREDLQARLKLKNRDNFRKEYIVPALKAGVIEMTIPEKPTSKNQRYRLTTMGKELKSILK